MKRTVLPARVTGMGCICAAGQNLSRCLSTLFEGKAPNPSPPRRFSKRLSRRFPVFEVPASFFKQQFFSKNDNISITARFALAAVKEALNDAGYSIKALSSKRVGVCVGTTTGAALNFLSFYHEYKKGNHPPLTSIKRYLVSNPALVIKDVFELDGPCQTVVNACSSATDAIGIGLSWLQAGLCDIVIAGGADELTPIAYNGFISLMITDDQPSKPFDRNRKGLNLGEGAAMMVLEPYEVGQSRITKTRGYVLGYGSSCDAYHHTAPHPYGVGLKQAIVEALAYSGKKPKDISFINTHGTGTLDNDKVECYVIRDMFPGTPFISTKGYTGHALGAAGAIEAVLTIACMELGKIPRSAGFKNSDPELKISPVEEPTNLTGKIALSQSLAFGGNNSVLVVSREGL